MASRGARRQAVVPRLDLGKIMKSQLHNEDRMDAPRQHYDPQRPPRTPAYPSAPSPHPQHQGQPPSTPRLTTPRVRRLRTPRESNTMATHTQRTQAQTTRYDINEFEERNEGTEPKAALGKARSKPPRPTTRANGTIPPSRQGYPQTTRPDTRDRCSVRPDTREYHRQQQGKQQNSQQEGSYPGARPGTRGGNYPPTQAQKMTAAGRNGSPSRQGWAPDTWGFQTARPADTAKEKEIKEILGTAVAQAQSQAAANCRPQTRGREVTSRMVVRTNGEFQF